MKSKALLGELLEFYFAYFPYNNFEKLAADCLKK